ncbi:MAG: hypothetical protein SGI88_12095, partial [Candidatus Hydrogenedentes bacterium]|nr:hypothetical protein [Candidatus Hydrogenedentota bacterium]
LELDLAVSKDNQLIVSHEPWFNPVICLAPGGDSIPRRDAEKNLIAVRGCVPGANGGFVELTKTGKGK